ncbi:hypothetical protein SRHO_G00055370 [Serrasalmus rhombeus]
MLDSYYSDKVVDGGNIFPSGLLLKRSLFSSPAASQKFHNACAGIQHSLTLQSVCSPSQLYECGYKFLCLFSS